MSNTKKEIGSITFNLEDASKYHLLMSTLLGRDNPLRIEELKQYVKFIQEKIDNSYTQIIDTDILLSLCKIATINIVGRLPNPDTEIDILDKVLSIYKKEDSYKSLSLRRLMLDHLYQISEKDIENAWSGDLRILAKRFKTIAENALKIEREDT